MSGVKSLWDFTPFKGENQFKGKRLACAVHAHTDCGSLDGASTVKSMVKRMKTCGMTHVSVTEHGSLNSAASVHRYAKEFGMKVIHGVEAYIFWPNDIMKGKVDRYGNESKVYSHITIGFKTRAAYESYCKLTAVLYSDERYYKGKPVMNWEEFIELSGHGITVGTGCVGSWCNKPILDGYGLAEAAKRINMMIDVIGKENLFDEIIVEDLTHQYKKEDAELGLPSRLEVNECKPYFNHPDIQREINRLRLPLTKSLGIKPLFSQDAHYAEKAHKVAQDAKNDGWVMSQFQHVMCAGEIVEEARKSHSDILSDRDFEELIDNTHAYADMFSGYEFLTINERAWKIPKVSTTPKREIVKRAEESKILDLSEQVNKDRLNYEVSVLNSNQKLDGLNYLLMVSDIAEMAKKNDILMQLRGSGGGCLLANALGISVTNSLEYDLPFERFLTRGRINANTPPDFDMDFSDKHKILDLMKEKYGTHMVPLSIDILMKPKSAIKDSERFILGSVREETNRMTIKMPQIPQGISENDWMFGYTNQEGEHVKGYFEDAPDLQLYAKNNPEIWESVLAMCGISRQKSVHACAVIVADEPIHHFMPLCRVGAGKKATLAAAFSPKDVEYVGGLKVDILGVTALNTIQRAMNNIKKRTGEVMKWELFRQDPKVYEDIYHTGDTSATFQTKTKGITNLCIQTKPKNIDQISNLIALYRPSCLDWIIDREDFKGNAVEYYIQCSSGKLSPRYIHPDMIPIFESTFGVPLFQEQTLRVFRDLGGYTYEDAEGVRRAIGKKDAQALIKHLGGLKSTVMDKRGWSLEQAKELGEMIEASGKYGFNRSHSCVFSEQEIQTSIGNVKIGDMSNDNLPEVKFIDQDGAVKYEKPLELLNQGIKEVFEVEFEDGSKIQLTSDHRVWYNGQWVELNHAIKDGGEWSMLDENELCYMPVRKER
jgi:DNA polymerase-3 subunit alpha